MPERPYIQARQETTTFRFYMDPDGQLHIASRHGTTIEEAIETFRSGQRSEDEQHQRKVSETNTHVLLWAWYANRPQDREVVIISCYRKD